MDIPIEIITIDGLQTAHAVCGNNGPAVVALHGWRGSIASFWPVAMQLAKLNYTVYMVDLPGFGQTSLPSVSWGIDDYARFVTKYLDAQGLTQIYLLGHSFGGRVGLVLGADHAERISKMVVADIPVARSRKVKAKIALFKKMKLLAELPFLNTYREPIQRQMREWFGSKDYREAGDIRQTFVRIVEEELLPYAARISCPTLLIWGENDKDTPLWQGKRLEKTIPDAGLVVFKGAGHFSYLEKLREYVHIVNHFFADSK